MKQMPDKPLGSSVAQDTTRRNLDSDFPRAHRHLFNWILAHRGGLGGTSMALRDYTGVQRENKETRHQPSALVVAQGIASTYSRSETDNTQPPVVPGNLVDDLAWLLSLDKSVGARSPWMERWIGISACGCPGNDGTYLAGGVGAREGIISGYLVLTGLTVAEATTVAVASRLWFFLGEVFIFTIGILLDSTKHNRHRHHGWGSNHQ